MPVDSAPAPLPRLGNIHHAAYRCRDAEQTRWFYEEVLGLELQAALAFDTMSGLDEERRYMHLFFALGDGNFIAFFDDPDHAAPDWFERKHSFDMHIAFEVPRMKDLMAWQGEINRKGVTCLGPVDHGFVHSVYMYDPNGIQVEITCKDKKYDEIMADERRQSDTHLSAWTQATRPMKLDRFGAAALDRRTRKARP